MRATVVVLSIIVAAALAAGGAWLVLARPWTPEAAAMAATAVPTAPFRGIAVSGAADVALVAGATEGILIDGSDRGPHSVSYEVRDGTLIVEAGVSRRWWQWLGRMQRVPRIVVTYRALESIRLSGGVKLRAASIATPRLALATTGATSIRIDDIDTDDLELSASGAVKAELSGRARRQRVALSGAGVFRGSTLVGESVRVAVSGAGKASVHATHTLDVAISGAGSVDYAGAPQVTRNVSGAGSIRQRGAVDPDSRPRAIALARRGAG